jgi:hypothetical protein
VLYDIVKTTILKNKTSISVVNDIAETLISGDKTSISIYHDIEVFTITATITATISARISKIMHILATHDCRLLTGSVSDTDCSARISL